MTLEVLSAEMVGWLDGIRIDSEIEMSRFEVF